MAQATHKCINDDSHFDGPLPGTSSKHNNSLSSPTVDLELGSLFNTEPHLPPPKFEAIPDSHASGIISIIVTLWPSLPPITSIRSRTTTSSTDPMLLRITTKRGTSYEYCDPDTDDGGRSGPFLRRVYRKGSTGPWIRGVFTPEMIEAQRKKNEETARAAEKLVEEQKKADVGRKPMLVYRLKWLEGDIELDQYVHAGFFWMRRGAPAVETEEQRGAFLRVFGEHMAGCEFVGKRCS
ncbi:hypothetical protein BJ508DRAFT_418042 [Ascobolus immersus RN42]|uniref:Uncharacterized protein n=1 Tax=Ascobolus immersus RN42 TaxID=1160509 RepID=A0A3N4HUN9_ASCIM|nr:hypothetical protein BJ508DRAFT_418042 [Ascobolus immersus RN42]